MLTAGLAVIALFVLWEQRTAHPVLPLAMFRNASFTAANGISFCLFAGLGLCQRHRRPATAWPAGSAAATAGPPTIPAGAPKSYPPLRHNRSTVALRVG
jgi:hypothetical protein